MLTDIAEDQSVLVKCNRNIDSKEMDEIKLIVELEILAYLQLCAKVAIQSRCLPLKAKCGKGE